ncbi:ribonuclease 3-like isoform X1 [Frieseomelitta varia]|nr:ribonuclease 3-like isoform X1 [Frieseomelitta varia]XP_043518847.1 ribonuclease 3-like isoform X1 [Frieseomelitta varia]
MSDNNQSKNYNLLNHNSTPLIMKYALRKLHNNRRSQLNITHKNENTFMNDCHTNDILIRNAFMLKKPMVLLQRLSDIIKSSSPLSSSMINICVNDQFRNSNINVHPKVFNTIFNHSQKSLKLSGEGKITYRKKSKEILFQEKSPHDKIVTMHEFGNANAVSFTPFLSSTPKDKETPNDAKKKHDTRRTSYNESNKSKKNISLTVEENQQEVKKKDATYELIEPETPNLRRRLHEERNAKKENFDQRVTIKNSKVHFSNRLSDRNYEYNSALRTSNNEKKQMNNFATNTPKNSSKKNILRSPIHRSNSIKDSIPSTTKKVPNFAKIHKKMFAKSESIVDVKKRIIDRHTKMTALKKKHNSEKERLNSQGKNQLSKKSNENSSNQLGLKIRKNEATEYILRNKNNTSHSAKSKEQNRAILKGVRTNRRFELQMKFRNMNH